jgi:endonuclease G
MNLQTYYATNQTPQLQNKFNGSIWGSLETAVRNLATSSSDTVYVVTGPAYRKGNGSETINYLTGASQSANPSSLPIPNYYWKALLKVKRNGSGDITSAKAIGFWFDHRNYESSEHYYDSEHVVSVNQIETWTGLNLFHNLPGDDSSGIEQAAEANTSWSEFQSF